MFIEENAMATEKLADGIRKFADDYEKLEQLVKEKLIAYKTPEH